MDLGLSSAIFHTMHLIEFCGCQGKKVDVSSGYFSSESELLLIKPSYVIKCDHLVFVEL